MRPGKLSRRSFMKASAGAVAAVRTGQAMARPAGAGKSSPIRMGAPLFKKVEDPGEWAARVKELGYSAAYCPVRVGADPELVRAYAAKARSPARIVPPADRKNASTSFLEKGISCCVSSEGGKEPVSSLFTYSSV